MRALQDLNRPLKDTRRFLIYTLDEDGTKRYIRVGDSVKPLEVDNDRGGMILLGLEHLGVRGYVEQVN